MIGLIFATGIGVAYILWLTVRSKIEKRADEKRWEAFLRLASE